MEDKNKKDIVEEIVSRLKATPEHPYRAGAWEKFQADHLPPKKSIAWRYWSSAAAVLLLLGMGYIFQTNQLNTDQAIVHTPQMSGSDLPNTEIESVENAEKKNLLEEETTVVAQYGGKLLDDRKSHVDQKINNLIELQHEETSIALNLKPTIIVPLPQRIINVNSIKQQDNNELSKEIVSFPTQLAASALRPEEQGYSEDLPNKKNFNLSNKLDLGAFVSPTSTNQKVKVGGGLMLAYNLNNRLSVRTGISYHEYEVGIVQDPTQPSSTEIVAADKLTHKQSQNLLLEPAAANSNFVAIPNVNAVNGMVQSLDIPLELSYRIAKNFYATSGVSYAPILNQKRHIQYIENVNTNTFTGGVPSNQAALESANRVVTKTTESSEENVSSNGFGGFVNFSLGRKMEVNKKLSISVEPFVKLPVGNFRVSEMNYTNGGIRIITNF